MNLKQYIIALMVLGLCWSCSDDDETYTPDKPSTGTVFTVSVGIDKASVEQLGGEDVIRLMMYTNFASLSRDFNNAGEFNEMHFFMEDFFVFEGSSEGQLDKTHSTDITLIYNANSAEEDIPDGFYREKSLVSLSNQTIDLSYVFSHEGIDYFRYAMAMARGAVEYGNGNILVQNNKVGPKDYSAPSNVMNPFSMNDSWDDLTVALVRASGEGTPANFVNYIPSTIGLTVKEPDEQGEEGEGIIPGMVFSDVKITVYPVRGRSGFVTEEPIFEGTTDENGKINIAANGNPYAVPSGVAGINEIVYPNLFIEVDREGVKQYTFLPLTEVLTSIVVDGNTSFNKVWEVNLKTLEDMTIVAYDFEDGSDLDANTSLISAQTTASHTTEAKVGNGAIVFEGAQYFVVNQDEKINPGKDYSVSYWFKTNTKEADTHYALWTMSDWSGDTSDDPWRAGGLTVRYQVDNISYDVGWEGGSSESASIADDQWHQLLTVVDYTEDDPNRADISIYIDGVLVFSSNSSIYTPYWNGDNNPIDPSSFQVKLGFASTAGDAATPFTGIVDDLRIFDSALDASWAFQLHDQTK